MVNLYLSVIYNNKLFYINGNLLCIFIIAIESIPINIEKIYA